ncbi:MAG: alpha/beta hydrolase [Mycobacteriaceae bacterium]
MTSTLDDQNVAPHTIKSTFTSQGHQCAATLYLPPNSDSQMPAILLVQGWGGVQDALTPPFCDAFLHAGFAVMTFDYQSWGNSQGLPRNNINPWSQIKTVDNALAHLKSQPNVDAKKIVLWGSSFGGGHVVNVAAQHPELLGTIAQVPMLDGLKAVKAVPFIRLLRFFIYGVGDFLKPGAPIYVPIVGLPGKFSSMDRDGAHDMLIRAVQEANFRPDRMPYDNRVTAKSLLTIALYRSLKALKNISVPTLIIGATRDTVAPFIESKIHRINNPRIRIRTIESNHFEPYFDDAFQQNIKHQLKFLKELTHIPDPSP